MPTYVYLCDKCGEEFNRIMSIKEYGEAKTTCPKCKSPQVRQQCRIHRQDLAEELVECFLISLR